MELKSEKKDLKTVSLFLLLLKCVLLSSGSKVKAFAQKASGVCFHGEHKKKLQPFT